MIGTGRTLVSYPLYGFTSTNADAPSDHVPAAAAWLNRTAAVAMDNVLKCEIFIVINSLNLKTASSVSEE